MSEYVQITLIICGTIIISQIISLFKKEEKINQIVEIKQPNFPKPPSTSSGTKDNSRLDEIFKRN